MINPALTARVKAARLRLGVKTDKWTEADIRVAAAEALRRAHPDTGGVSDSETGPTIARVKADKALLLRYATPQPGSTCPHCKGTGHVFD